MRAENLSGPGAIGVAPDLANDWIGVADMANGTCLIDGCDKPVTSRGWCRSHYDRWRKHGDPLAGPSIQIRGDDEARFWSYVELGDWNDCWLWTGALLKGYGYLTIGGRNVKAHRYAYELLAGPIPDDLPLDHTCHPGQPGAFACRRGTPCPHRRCVNPLHLEPVTNAENVRRGLSTFVDLDRTVCPAGHEYDRVNRAGHRFCSTCSNASSRASKARKRALAALDDTNGGET